VLMGLRTPPSGVDRREPDAQRALLERTFAGAGWVSDQVLADLAGSTDLVVEEVGQVHLPAWTSGPVALLGDAAWCTSPLSGLGTSTALVGAYVLAGELARAGGDHRAAFTAYEAVLRPYVAQAQQLPAGGVDGFLPATRAALAIRLQLVTWMTRWPLRAILARQFGKAESIDLPDYDLGRYPTAA
jgi:2-polyprenyl-6-methoxyphenol hydroxylase-like FAD-dependent oxidoreductase